LVHESYSDNFEKLRTKVLMYFEDLFFNNPRTITIHFCSEKHFEENLKEYEKTEFKASETLITEEDIQSWKVSSMQFPDLYKYGSGVNSERS
jgi:Zn-dependent M16 (insulinase) family peptidase